MSARASTVAAVGASLGVLAVAGAALLLGLEVRRLLPPTLDATPDRLLRILFAVLLAPVLGFVAGSVPGAAPGRVLRRRARRTGGWILANALGWAAAFPLICLLGSMPVMDTPLALTIVLAVSAGGLGGLSLGVVTGAFLLLDMQGGVMRCRDVMKKEVARCLETLSVQACARMMRDNNVGFLPVVDSDKQVVGLITDRDLAVRVLAEDLPPGTPVGHVMTRDVRICRPDDNLKDAEWKMASTRKSRLVIADEEGHCVGVISLSDIAQADSRSRAGGVLRAVTRREAPLQIELA